MNTKSKNFNHNPAQLGVWFEYNGWRFKDVYHVKTVSGEVFKFMYPNANSWRPCIGALAGTPNLSDKDIAEIMLVPDEELTAVGSFRFVGESRIKYNLELFEGHYIPPLVSPSVAIQALTQSMKNDSSYAWCWFCNVAMSHVDAGCDHQQGNEAAVQFMKQVFDIDVTTFDEYKTLLKMWEKVWEDDCQPIELFR